MVSLHSYVSKLLETMKGCRAAGASTVDHAGPDGFVRIAFPRNWFRRVPSS